MSEEHAPASQPAGIATPIDPDGGVAEIGALLSEADKLGGEDAGAANEAPAPAEAPAEAAEPALKPHTDETGLLSLKEPAETPEKPPEADAPEQKPQEAAQPAEYALNLPENWQFSPESVEEFTNFSRENGIAPETAQKLVDMHVKSLQNYDAMNLQRQHDAFAEMRRDWRTRIMADPDLGGSAFETNRQMAMRGLQAIVPPQYREAFDQALSLTGMSDHPEFFRAMLAAGKLLAEPRAAPVPANPPPSNNRRTPTGGGGRLSYAYPRSRRDQG